MPPPPFHGYCHDHQISGDTIWSIFHHHYCLCPHLADHHLHCLCFFIATALPICSLHPIMLITTLMLLICATAATVHLSHHCQWQHSDFSTVVSYILLSSFQVLLKVNHAYLLRQRCFLLCWSLHFISSLQSINLFSSLQTSYFTPLPIDFTFFSGKQPKCGFLPFSRFIAEGNAIKKSVTRFRMHQILKLHQQEVMSLPYPMFF